MPRRPVPAPRVVVKPRISVIVKPKAVGAPSLSTPAGSAGGDPSTSGAGHSEADADDRPDVKRARQDDGQVLVETQSGAGELEAAGSGRMAALLGDYGDDSDNDG